jgi:glycosyltransferase involved in cell wall biosynthesis
MRLSILIPSIPSRFDKLLATYNHIASMCDGKDIEVLAFTDNKKRSIGEKRDALVQMSNGKYVMFVDDDDTLLSVDEIYEATLEDVDVITFKQECLNTDKSTFVVDFGLGNDIEHNTDDKGNYLDCKRPPFHVCAWHKKYKEYRFPNVNYGEDWAWVEQFIKYAQTELHIDKVLHKYNFDPKVTEASTEDNEIWTNPNKIVIDKKHEEEGNS